jgi:hypothetical protein
MKTLPRIVSCLFMLSFFIAAPSVGAQPSETKGTGGAPAGEDAELAQELSNPLADLMSIPFQMNYDCDIGPRDDGWKMQTNIQPVIPFHLNTNWNLISRTIIPVIDQEDIFPGAGSQFGLGDINLSLFLSPKKPTSGGITWGIGPVLLLPTATDDLLGADKWGAGPTAVARISATPFCSRLRRIHGRAPGPYPCSPRAATTGRRRSGLYPSMPPFPSSSNWANCPSACRPGSATGRNRPKQDLKGFASGSRPLLCCRNYFEHLCARG